MPLLCQKVMSHTELLFRVNIHWLLVIHSYDVRTIETLHTIIFLLQKKKNILIFFFFRDDR